MNPSRLLLCAQAMVLFAGSLARAETAGSEQTSVLERYVAIDDVCAWPIVSRMTDGRLGLAIFNQPTHGHWEGAVEFWTSADDGRKWTRAGTPVPNQDGEARMNHAYGQAANGDQVVIVGGHGNRPKPGTPRPEFDNKDALHAVAALSSDQGSTWRPAAPIPRRPGRTICPFGPIVTMPDGTLLASFYDWPADDAGPKEGSAFLYRSTDHGSTWSCQSEIAPRDYNETTLHVVDDKRILAAARTFNSQTLHLYVSEDGGNTWTMRGPLSGDYEHNGHLLTLPDGRILLTYGVRHPHDLALNVRVSPDGGLTWRRSHRLIQIDDVERYDGGYPSSVAVGDDLILTVYYSRRSPRHHRYHMGAVLWNWREEFNHGFDR